MWYMSALSTFHFAVLVHALQPTDLVMMQHFFAGIHDHGPWWRNDVLRLHYHMTIYIISKLLICRNSSPCPNALLIFLSHNFSFTTVYKFYKHYLTTYFSLFSKHFEVFLQKYQQNARLPCKVRSIS